jgi:hypothetical protein
MALKFVGVERANTSLPVAMPETEPSPASRLGDIANCREMPPAEDGVGDPLTLGRVDVGTTPQILGEAEEDQRIRRKVRGEVIPLSLV